jgi:DNA-binding transcriptional LysR family regulator
MPIEDLNDLYLFARVVEAGGFAAAERSTGIPKSRLSRRVAALETQLGVRLIQRSSHAFSVTDAGHGVYRHARAVAEEVQAVEGTVGETLNEPSGLVRMSSSLLTAELHLAGWIGEFISQHPKVRVSLDLTNRFVDLVAERYDLVIRFSTYELDSSDVIARNIGFSQMVLVASPALLARHGMPAEIADLHRLPALGQGSMETVRPWSFLGKDGSTIVHAPEPRLAMDSIIALREAAIRGAGVIQLPLDACRAALAAGELRTVLERYPSIGTKIFALYPNRRGVPAAVRALLAFLEERFRAAY